MKGTRMTIGKFLAFTIGLMIGIIMVVCYKHNHHNNTVVKEVETEPLTPKPTVKAVLGDNGSEIVVPPGWKLYIELEASWYQVIRFEKVPKGVKLLNVVNIRAKEGDSNKDSQWIGLLFEVNGPGVLNFSYLFREKYGDYTLKLVIQ